MSNPFVPLLRQLRQVLQTQSASPLTDAQLLERWLGQRDEAAFELLLWRHGPLVLGVCRRLLRQPQEVEDAFQATFLILVRKANTLRNQASLAGWLYRVASRAAGRLRTAAVRRAAREAAIADVPAAACDDHFWRDLRGVLDEEIGCLPERYRGAFVLCYLQGKTNAQAAAELGCPVGTVLSRLSWARQRLRLRLGRRGVTGAGSVLAVLLARGAEAAVAPALVAATGRLAFSWTVGSEVTSAGAVSLAKGVLRTMLLTRIKTAAVAVLALGLVALTVGLTYPTQAREPEEKRFRVVDAPPARPAAPKPNLMEVPALRDGSLMVVGMEIKPGEKVPADQKIKVKIGGDFQTFRRLKVGDRVSEGQLLARLDDRLARDELQIAEVKIEAATAELRASQRTLDEARQQLTRAKALGDNKAISAEDLRAAELTVARYEEEVNVKKTGVKIAELQFKTAKTVVEMHEIRSPVNGIIKALYKKRGEAVKNLEPVFQIEISEAGGKETGALPTGPEATRARFQRAESYRQEAARENQNYLIGEFKDPEARARFRNEYRHLLKKAAKEFDGLRQFLNKLEPGERSRHLTEEERLQIPFIAAECLFNLGEHEAALKIYQDLAGRYADKVEGLSALGGMVRCHAALGQKDQIQQRLKEIRRMLNNMDGPIRQEWERWLQVASPGLVRQQEDGP